MIVLGISGGILSGNQDGAAALIQDGRLLAAAEEERFSRMKHASGRLPLRAIKYCLAHAGIGMDEVDTVAFPGATYRNFTEILNDYFDFHFGHCPEVKLFDHHRCHAASAYYCWDQDPALILTMDFSGDGMSTCAAVGEQGRLRDLYRIPKPNSLGIFYSLLTQYLGFEKDNDEYKVMGLSAFGDPGKLDFGQVLHIEGEHYHLNTDYLKLHLDPSRPSPSKQER
ncbi:MAG: carbamoyl transferase, partial [Planctomycetes bacterium]|nr:carbamoyl transferase [Planctomycetota bacterium]